MRNNKVIDCVNVWSCDNMDIDAPINWEGYCVLFDDNTKKFVDDLDEVAEHGVATTEEKKDFCRTYYNRVFQNDYIDIIRGRMKGQRKKVISTFTYTIQNTFGKCKIDYFVFDVGTKTADTNTNYYVFNFEDLRVLRGGRI